MVTDGGPEFGTQWTDALSNDGTQHVVTAAYAPWQNGTCERRGGVWKVAFGKMSFENEPQNREEVEEVCDQVTCAHNTLVRKDGFSPAQHVLVMIGESNEHVESGLDVHEPSIEKSMKIRRAARLAFLDADCEQRVRRAISHRTRPARGPFETGCMVHIWRKGQGEKKAHWHGPGKVVGAQHDKVWVALGTKMYRCAPEQVKRVSIECEMLRDWLPINMQQHRDTVRERGAGNIVELDRMERPLATEDDHMEIERDLNEEFRNESHEPSLGNPDEPMNGQDEPIHRDDGNTGEAGETGDQAGVGDMHVDQEIHSHGSDRMHDDGISGSSEPQHEPETSGPVNEVSNGETQTRNQNDGGYGPVRVTGLTRALRRDPNLLDHGVRAHVAPYPPQRPEDRAEEEARDWARMIMNEHVVGDEVFIVAAKRQGRKEVKIKDVCPQKAIEAKSKEWQKMITSGAVRVHVGDEAKRLIDMVGVDRLLDSRFVHTTDDGTLTGALKSRWCIRGYKDPDLLELETAAPTLSSEGFAIACQIIASCGWGMTIGDIEAAFLRGDGITRQKGRVLVKIPSEGIPDVPPTAIIELLRPVYGLADAPRLWWKSLTKTLSDLGMTQSKLDSCLFYYRSSAGTLEGVVAFHVDDLLFGGTKNFQENVFHRLQSKYPFKHVKHGKGEFLGKFLEQMSDGTIVIQQKEYAEAVASIPISKERRKQKDQNTTDQEKAQMRAVLGEVNWLVSGTRPDLAASCSLMQQRTTSSVVQDLIEVNRLVAMVRDFSGLEIRIKPVPMEDVEIAVWSDASFANAAEKKSQGGYILDCCNRLRIAKG